MKNKKYYLGLDIGSDSVGYAVTDEEYNLLKFHGEPAWGATLFDAPGGSTSDSRSRLFSARTQAMRTVSSTTPTTRTGSIMRNTRRYII